MTLLAISCNFTKITHKEQFLEKFSRTIKNYTFSAEMSITLRILYFIICYYICRLEKKIMILKSCPDCPCGILMEMQRVIPRTACSKIPDV